MVRSLTFLLFVLPFVQLNAADTTATWKDVVKTFKKKEVSIAQIKLSGDRTLHGVEVIDVRSDSSRIGMFSDFNFKPNEIVFEKAQTLTEVIPMKLANNEKPGYNVLMIVQDFWLTEQRAQKILSRDDQEKPEVRTSRVVCKIDVFIQYEDKYLPLTRIDTILWDKKALSISCKELMSDAFSLINYQVRSAISTSKFLSRKKVNKEDIFSAYQQRFSHAAFTGGTVKRGLYTSLEEFKNNNPYSENFVIKRHTKEPPSLYLVDANGNETLTRNVWGVCDGKNMYIMQKGMLFKLYKNENAFYWMGLKYFDLRMYETPPATPLYVDARVGMEEPVANNVKIRLTPFLLHPETGEGY